MGLPFLIALNGLLVKAVLGLVKKPGSIRIALQRWVARPTSKFVSVVWVTLIFIAGEFFQLAASWPAPTQWGNVDAWELAEVVAVIGVCIFLLLRLRELRALEAFGAGREARDD